MSRISCGLLRAAKCNDYNVLHHSAKIKQNLPKINLLTGLNSSTKRRVKESVLVNERFDQSPAPIVVTKILVFSLQSVFSSFVHPPMMWMNPSEWSFDLTPLRLKLVDICKNVKTGQKPSFQWPLTQLFFLFEHKKHTPMGGYHYFCTFFQKCRNSGRFWKKVYFSLFFSNFAPKKWSSKLFNGPINEPSCHISASKRALKTLSPLCCRGDTPNRFPNTFFIAFISQLQQPHIRNPTTSATRFFIAQNKNCISLVESVFV